MVDDHGRRCVVEVAVCFAEDRTFSQPYAHDRTDVRSGFTDVSDEGPTLHREFRAYPVLERDYAFDARLDGTVLGELDVRRAVAPSHRTVDDATLIAEKLGHRFGR